MNAQTSHSLNFKSTNVEHTNVHKKKKLRTHKRQNEKNKRRTHQRQNEKTNVEHTNVKMKKQTSNTQT